ncbi:hypothetical protein AAFF_G00407680 [Aldrovandia affinis]|uniref:Uncharacterized protein n=1 Tax=Aldrovandia affinis TaxID=143900 RepID=A0AAD7SC79_9TELE|nr:hypothetical protein AAFF_G00407680 [Aldrovandia affinis]
MEFRGVSSSSPERGHVGFTEPPAPRARLTGGSSLPWHFGAVFGGKAGAFAVPAEHRKGFRNPQGDIKRLKDVRSLKYGSALEFFNFP